MELVYEEMNQRNIWYKTKPVVNADIGKGRCYAAYGLGNWYLQPSFQRLLTKLKGLVGDYACLYKPVPYQSEGLLHQTLLQFIKFESYPHAEEVLTQAMACVADVIAQSNFAPWITYRGLVWTSTGLALAGYCDEDDKLMRLREEIAQALKNNQLPCEIPYFNNILHATVSRWTKQPDGLTLVKLEKEVERWSECVFGDLRVNRWVVGKASYRMKEEERDDYFAIPVFQHICHRGNVSGPQKELENNFGVLIQRSIQGYRVEVDVWYHENNLWLGHDKPEYKITLDWLASCKKRLIHAKDGKTFEYLLLEAGKRALDLHVFYHTEEDYVLTNKGLVICYPGKPLLEGSLCMMPERAKYTPEDFQKSFSICSDRRDAVSSHPCH
jgi:hypothetical protein